MKNPKIIAAFAVGCAFVLLAIVTSDFGDPTAPTPQEAAARIAKAPERKHIPVADADNNGIPDWQEQIVPDATPLTLTGDAGDYSAPDTLTGQASIEFFKQYMDVKSGNSLATTEDAFIENFADNVLMSSEDMKLRPATVITTPQNDPETLRAYVNTVAQIFISNGFIGRAGDELIILNEAISTENPAKLDELDAIVDTLTRSITAASALTVPSSMVDAHINIINTATSIKNDILGMGKLYEDPMYAFVRLRRYDQDTINITNAFFDLEEQAQRNGATFAPNDPINFQ